MIIFKEQKELKKYLAKLNNSSIGFVPTMGALHQGHISLIKRVINHVTLLYVAYM